MTFSSALRKLGLAPTCRHAFVCAAIAIELACASGCLDGLGVQSNLDSASNGVFQGVQGATVLSPNSVKLTWNGAGGYQSYQVYSSAFNTAIGSSVFSSYTVSGLVPNTSYQFSVGGVPQNGSSNGALDGIQNSVTTQTWPLFPGVSQLQASTPYTLQANWSYFVTGPTYNVYVQTAPPPIDFTTPAVTTQSSVVGITKLADGTLIQPVTTYYVAVRATFLDQSSDSNMVSMSVTTPSPINPQPVAASDAVIFGNTPRVVISGGLSTYLTSFKQVMGDGSLNLLGSVTGNNTFQVPTFKALPAGQNTIRPVVTSGSDSLTLPDLPVYVRSLSKMIDIPSLTNGHGRQRLGQTMAVGDFNCDGFQDLAVSAPAGFFNPLGFLYSYYYLNSYGPDGGIYVFYGSAAGLSASNMQLITLSQLPAGSPIGGNQIGNFAMAAGNFNGDTATVGGVTYGCDDLAASVGNPWGTTATNVIVYFGKAGVGLQSGIPATNTTACVGSTCQPLLIQPPAAAACPPTAGVDGAAPDFGFSLATGQVHKHVADTYTDLLVGAPTERTWSTCEGVHGQNDGAIYIYYGSSQGFRDFTTPVPYGAADSAPYTKIYAPSIGTVANYPSYYAFGSSVAAVDLDGDGIDDIVVGDPSEANSPYYPTYYAQGSVYYFPSSSNGVTANGYFPATPEDPGNSYSLNYTRWTNPYADQTTALSNGSYFGGKLARAGDINGDGYADLVIAPGYSDVQAWNANNGLASNNYATLTVVYGGSGGPQTGSCYTSDTGNNGTGFAGVCAPNTSQSCDGAGNCGIMVIPYATGTHSPSNQYPYLWMGVGLAAAGPPYPSTLNPTQGKFGGEDVEGKGYASVIVGWNTTYSPSTEQANVYFGGPYGLAPTASSRLYPVTWNSNPVNMGEAVALGSFRHAQNGHSGNNLVADAASGAPDADTLVTVPMPSPTPSATTTAPYNGAVYSYKTNCPGTADCSLPPSDFSPDSILTPNSSKENYATSGPPSSYALPVGDLNGDGFTDVAMGVYRFRPIRTSQFPNYDQRDVVIYYGGPQGPITSPLPSYTPVKATDPLIIPGPNSAGNVPYWTYFASAGDTNGDGFDDLLLYSATGITASSNTGWVVYFGSGTGLQTSQLPALPPAPSMAPLILNGSGGIITGLTATTDFNDGIPAEAITAGDFNGDGFDDIAIGTYSGSAPGPTERVIVIYGSRNGPQTDGTVDLSNPDSPGPGTASNVVQANPPCTGTIPNLTCKMQLLVSLTGGTEYFGNSVKAAGDVNGDGYGDLLVGAAGNATLGAGNGGAYLFFGSPTGLMLWNASVSGLLIVPNWVTGYGGQTLRRAGTSVAGVGDLNKDGFDDIVLGAYDDGTLGGSVGGAYVFYGCSNGMNNTASTCATGVWGVNASGAASTAPPAANQDNPCNGVSCDVQFVSPVNTASNVSLHTNLMIYWGMQVAGPGDMNQDGYADLLIVNGYSVNTYQISNAASGQVENMGVVLYTGGPNGLKVTGNPTQNPSCLGGQCTPLWIAPDVTGWGVTKEAFDTFGYLPYATTRKKVDINGDGMPDLLISSWAALNASQTTAFAGGFYLYW